MGPHMFFFSVFSFLHTLQQQKKEVENRPPKPTDVDQ